MNNLELIKPFLTFTSDDDFYYLQIIQRRKDNPDKNLSSSNRVIKNYYIGNIEYLERKWDEIKSLSDFFNARAMIRLNKRSYKKTAFKALEKVANVISNEAYKSVKNSYASAAGRGNNDPNKTWIIDLDHEDSEGQAVRTVNIANGIHNLINDIQPTDVGDKEVIRLPSPNGIHMITKPFNLQVFKQELDAHGWRADVKKDNPTNLYIPDLITKNRLP